MIFSFESVNRNPNISIQSRFQSNSIWDFYNIQFFFTISFIHLVPGHQAQENHRDEHHIEEKYGNCSMFLTTGRFGNLNEIKLIFRQVDRSKSKMFDETVFTKKMMFERIFYWGNTMARSRISFDRSVVDRYQRWACPVLGQKNIQHYLQEKPTFLFSKQCSSIVHVTIRAESWGGINREIIIQQ